MITTLTTEDLADNQPALDMLFSLGGTKLSKFIFFRQRYIKNENKKRKNGFKYVSSSKMKEDILKKALTCHKFNTNRYALFLFDCTVIGNEGARATKQ